MSRGPLAGDYVVVYGRLAHEQPRLELIRLAAAGERDTLVRSTLTPAAVAGARFETEALARAKAAGTLAWRQTTDGIVRRLEAE